MLLPAVPTPPRIAPFTASCAPGLNFTTHARLHGQVSVAPAMTTSSSPRTSCRRRCRSVPTSVLEVTLLVIETVCAKAAVAEGEAGRRAGEVKRAARGPEAGGRNAPGDCRNWDDAPARRHAKCGGPAHGDSRGGALAARPRKPAEPLPGRRTTPLGERAAGTLQPPLVRLAVIAIFRGVPPCLNADGRRNRTQEKNPEEIERDWFENVYQGDKMMKPVHGQGPGMTVVCSNVRLRRPVEHGVAITSRVLRLPSFPGGCRSIGPLLVKLQWRAGDGGFFRWIWPDKSTIRSFENNCMHHPRPAAP